MVVAAFDATGLKVALPPVTWSSSDLTVATVSASGLVTAIGPGMATVRAEAGAVVGAAPVYVVIKRFGVAILPDGEFGDTLQLAPGQTLQLSRYKYQVSSPDTVLTPTDATTWSSSRSDLVTVSNTGMLTALGAGVTLISVAVDQSVATRPVRVAATPGTTTVRFVNAADALSDITLVPNTTAPVHLIFGGVQEATVPAGTLQVAVSGVQPVATYFDPNWIDVQQFLGFLPAQTHTTFVAVGNTDYSGFTGNLTLAALFDWTALVPADSVEVRVMLATTGGYNVYFTPPGVPVGVLFLQGCYLDWPFGFTDYAARAPGAFDIVLQAGKGITGPEAARFHVTPDPGHAVTYVLTGKSVSALTVLTLVDH